jgi:hypothetical protein
MRRRRLFAVAILFACWPLNAVETPEISPTQASAAFERLKSLTGEWEGESERGGKSTLTYKVLSRGSVVLETYRDVIPPPGDEMITAYYLDGDRLLLTHYCIAKNQPRMIARRWDPKTGELFFEFLDATNLKDSQAGHMHTIEFRFLDQDHILSGSQYFEKGKLQFHEQTLYTRIK